MQMCVEMVIAAALRNRDRLLLIWPRVNDFLAAILAPAQVQCARCVAHGYQQESCKAETLRSDLPTLALALQCWLHRGHRRRCRCPWSCLQAALSQRYTGEKVRCAQGNGKQGATQLVARAALGLLRVCQRLLPYKPDTADALLRSLQLLLRLSPAAAWDLAQPIATEVSQPACTPRA